MVKITWSLLIRRDAWDVIILSRSLGFTLSVEFSAESLALLLRLEFVWVSAAAAVYERLAHMLLRVVVIRGDGAVAVAGIDRRQTDRALRLCDWRSYRGRDCRCGLLPLTLDLAGCTILEAILVALAAAVIELVAGIGALVVVELFDRTVARTHYLG